MFSILDWTLPCRWSVSLLWLWSPVAFMEELKCDHCFISLMACQRRSPVMVGTKPNQLDKVIACWLAIITLMHKHKTGSRLIMVDADMRLLWSMHLPMLISSTKQILGRPLRVRRNGFCFMQLGIYRSPLDIWPVFYTCKDVGYNTDTICECERIHAWNLMRLMCSYQGFCVIAIPGVINGHL